MFIVIEMSSDAKYATIVTNENSENMVFASKEEAQKIANECQNGIIVEITTN